MSLVILTMSCAAHRGEHQRAARETWLTTAAWQHRFVLGDCIHDVGPDEIAVDVPDDYVHLVFKQRAAYDWAMRNDFDFAFVACIDTYISIPRLARCGFVDHDYMGCCCDSEPHPSGGAGYFLSRKAMEALVHAETVDFPDRADYGALVCEGIALHHDPRFRGTYTGWDKDMITAHLSRGTGNYDPDWMRACHEEYLACLK